MRSVAQCSRANLSRGADHAEGVSAIQGKRAPVFNDR
jgi:hypothetical protein